MTVPTIANLKNDGVDVMQRFFEVFNKTCHLMTLTLNDHIVISHCSYALWSTEQHHLAIWMKIFYGKDNKF